MHSRTEATEGGSVVASDRRVSEDRVPVRPSKPTPASREASGGVELRAREAAVTADPHQRPCVWHCSEAQLEPGTQ